MSIFNRIALAARVVAAGLLFGPGFPGPGWAREPSVTPPVAQSAAASDAAQEPLAAAPDSSRVVGPQRRPLLTVAELVGVNTGIWSFDRYIRQGGENPGFRIGINSWQENLQNGFEWDDNNFATNQFAHPYHGSMYFNAARSNGYDFWESVPFTFGGSFLWEYFYEKHHPSYNDWGNTSIGGVALGEMLWRLSDMVLDNSAQGGGRRWREVGALLLNPMRGVTRMLTGDWSRVGPNPPGRFPGRLVFQLDAGLRTAGEGKVWEADTTRAFLELQGLYGDPFGGDRRKPFDSFELGAQLNFGDASVLAGVKAHGLLGAAELKKTENVQHLLGGFLNYDYINTYAYEVGQQSLGLGLLSRFTSTPFGRVDTQVHLNGIVLGAVGSDYENFTGRAYDYGPGASAVVSAALVRRDRPWLVIRHGQYWVHTLNGTVGEHHLSVTRVQLDVPVAPALGVGVQYLLYLAENDYRDYPDTHHRLPEVRVSIALPLQ